MSAWPVLQSTGWGGSLPAPILSTLLRAFPPGRGRSSPWSLYHWQELETEECLLNLGQTVAAFSWPPHCIASPGKAMKGVFSTLLIFTPRVRLYKQHVQ